MQICFAMHSNATEEASAVGLTSLVVVRNTKLKLRDYFIDHCHCFDGSLIFST